MKKVNVIVPSYNGARLLEKMFEALVKAIDDKIDWIMTLVDDGSDDNTEMWAKEHSERVRYVQQPTNLGFAKACNRGAKVVEAEYLLFLNNDTEPKKNFLREMLKCAESPPYPTIVGAKLIFPGEKLVQHAGIMFTAGGYPYEFGQGKNPNHPDVIRTREMPAVTAATMLVKKEVFDRLEGFCEEFVNGWEDSDFCLKAKEMGQKIYYCAEAEVIHHRFASDGRFAHESYNRQLYRDKWIHHRRLDLIAPFWMGICATWHCVCKCKNCKIWANQKKIQSEDMDPMLFQAYTSDTFFDNITNVAIFGGEPTIHDNLLKLLGVVYTRWPGIEIGIITSGVHPESQRLIWETVKNNFQGNFVVRVSLDGREETHDRLRGVKGMFEQAMTTARLVNKLWPGVGGISITVYPDTIDELPYLIDLCEKMGIRFCIRAGISGSYLGAKVNENWTPEQIEKLRDAIHNTPSKFLGFDRFAQALPDFLESGMHRACEAFRRSLVVDTNLMVSMCHNRPPMCHLRDLPKYWGKTAEWCRAGTECLTNRCFTRSCHIDGPYSTVYVD